MINEDFKSISEIIKAFPNEAACITHLEALKWNGTIISPFDAHSKVYVCKKNKYRCRTTGKYFNVKNNTIFYNSKIELQKWFIAIWLITVKEKSITSIELADKLSLTQKTAWFMLKKIKTQYLVDFKIKNSKKEKRKVIKKEVVEIETVEIEMVVVEKKLQLTEWLQQLKK